MINIIGLEFDLLFVVGFGLMVFMFLIVLVCSLFDLGYDCGADDSVPLISIKVTEREL